MHGKPVNNPRWSNKINRLTWIGHQHPEMPTEFAAAVARVWNKNNSPSYRLRENQATVSEKYRHRDRTTPGTNSVYPIHPACVIISHTLSCLPGRHCSTGGIFRPMPASSILSANNSKNQPDCSALDTCTVQILGHRRHHAAGNPIPVSTNNPTADIEPPNEPSGLI